jgi:hypothetical protein
MMYKILANVVAGPANRLRRDTGTTQAFEWFGILFHFATKKKSSRPGSEPQV